MELSNSRTVPLPRAVVWAALNDAAVLKDCLPGCETIEPDGDHAWKVVMAARVGPVSARFNGRMSMTDIREPETYTLQFAGQGGAAGFARGDARVTLTPIADDRTEMAYVARAQVGGKLAQIGSRLVDGAAAKLADDFFARFVTRAAPPAAAGETVAAPSEEASLLAPAGGTPWVRYAAIAAIIVVLILLYTRGYR